MSANIQPRATRRPITSLPRIAPRLPDTHLRSSRGLQRAGTDPRTHLLCRTARVTERRDGAGR